MSRRKSRVGFFDRAIALSAALVVFGGFAVFLWTSTQKPEKREAIQAFDAKEIATIAASTVTEDQIKQQKDKILKKEKEKKRQEKKKQDLEKKKLEDLKKKQDLEKKKLEDLKKKQAEEKKAIALRKKKAEEDEKKRKRDEKKRKEKEAADKKRKLAEKKKREEAEKKKQAEELAKKARQDDLQAEIAAERAAAEQRAAQQQSARASTTLKNRYAKLITDRLQSNFSKPAGSRPNRGALVNIKLDPSGNVLSSRIVTSSGDFSYDQAVLAAVGRSSPLPLPQDNPKVRQELQDLNLTADFQL